jgi:hypothetical protein
MLSRIGLSLLALVVAGGCSGSDAAGPASPLTSPRATTASLSESFPRSGAVHLTKDCTLYTGLAGSFCTITASNLPEIEVGSTIVYATAATPTSVDSDMILDPPEPGNNAASGHVIVDRVAGRSDITFSGGTGKFTHFSATIVGTRLPGRIWALEGTYSFSPRE